MTEFYLSKARVQRRVLVVKPRAIISLLISFFAALAVYLRMQVADYNFSYDYDAYIRITERLSYLSFSQIFGENFAFPYIFVQGIVAIEIGFGLLLKAVSLTGAPPAATVGAIAAFSVGLRVQVMQSLGMPRYWIFFINLFAITLLEANALRLGIAISVLLFGVRNIYWCKNISGSLAIAASTLLHLQVIFFVVPFVIFYTFSNLINRSSIVFILTVLLICAVMLFAIGFLPLLSNDKLQEYVARGASGSAGLSITSATALILFGSTAVSLRSNPARNIDSEFFTVILTSSLPSLLLMMLVTNVAVIGDRAWQVAFIVFNSFFFLDWARGRSKLLPAFFLVVLMSVVITNVLFRYPLSNFFSPPLPNFTP